MNAPHLDPEDDEPTLPKLPSRPAPALQTPLPVAIDAQPRPKPRRGGVGRWIVLGLSSFVAGWLGISGAAATYSFIARGPATGAPAPEPRRETARAVASRSVSANPSAPCRVAVAADSATPPAAQPNPTRALPIAPPPVRPSKPTKPPVERDLNREPAMTAATKRFPPAPDAGSDPPPAAAFDPVNIGF